MVGITERETRITRVPKATQLTDSVPLISKNTTCSGSRSKNNHYRFHSMELMQQSPISALRRLY